MDGPAGGVNLYIKHPLGNYPAPTGPGDAGILDSVFQEEQYPWLRTGVLVIDQDSSLPQQVAIAL